MKQKRGFTLIEVLISISVLSIGIIGIFQLFPQMSRINLHAKKQAQAAYLAQEQIEELSNIRYSDLVIQVIESKTEVAPGFQRETEIELVDKDLESITQDIGLKKIRVSVFWTLGGKEKSSTFYHIRTKE